MNERVFRRARAAAVALVCVVAAAAWAPTAMGMQQERDDLFRRYAYDGMLRHDVFDFNPQLLDRMRRDGMVLRSYRWDGRDARQVYMPAMYWVNRNLDSDIYDAVRFYGHYYPNPAQYGRSLHNNRAVAQPVLARGQAGLDSFEIAPLPGASDSTAAADAAEATQQPIVVEVAAPGGGTKRVIISEPIPTKLSEAWAAFAGGDDAGAVALFSTMTSSSPHANERSREASLGLMLSQVGAAIGQNRNVADVGQRISSALQGDAQLAGLAPEDESVQARVSALAERARSLATSAEDGAAYRSLADTLDRLAGT